MYNDNRTRRKHSVHNILPSTQPPATPTTNTHPTPQIHHTYYIIYILESIIGRIRHNLIVQRCRQPPLLIVTQRGSRQAVHTRIGYILDLHRNAKLPHTNGFIVRGGHKAPVVVYEGDGVDCTCMSGWRRWCGWVGGWVCGCGGWVSRCMLCACTPLMHASIIINTPTDTKTHKNTQHIHANNNTQIPTHIRTEVVVIHLCHLTCACIPLIYLLIPTPSQQRVFLLRMKPYTVMHLSFSITPQHLACLGVPYTYHLVISCAGKTTPIHTEGRSTNTLREMRGVVRVCVCACVCMGV